MGIFLPQLIVPNRSFIIFCVDLFTLFDARVRSIDGSVNRRLSGGERVDSLRGG